MKFGPQNKTAPPPLTKKTAGASTGGVISSPSPSVRYKLAHKLQAALGPVDRETRSIAISAEDARAIIRELEQ